MALVDLLFGIDRVRIEDGTQLGVLTLDATLSEEHSAEVELTDHPVEAGADIADHKRLRPRALRITGIVSNTPIEILGAGFSAGSLAETAWQTLKELQAGDALLDVFTTLERYENMQIVSLRAPRDAARGNVLEVTIDFREVLTATSETVEAPEAAGAVKDLGRQPTPEAPEPVRQSLLSKLGALFGL